MITSGQELKDRETYQALGLISEMRARKADFRRTKEILKQVDTQIHYDDHGGEQDSSETVFVEGELVFPKITSTIPQKIIS